MLWCSLRDDYLPPFWADGTDRLSSGVGESTKGALSRIWGPSWTGMALKARI